MVYRLPFALDVIEGSHFDIQTMMDDLCITVELRTMLMMSSINDAAV